MNGFTTADEAAKRLASQIRGRHVLITGASPGGLGAEAARVVAKHAALVILAGRSLEKLRKTERDIITETPSSNLRLLVVDLASFDSIRRAADEVNAYVEPIDVLINNAAIMSIPTYTTLPGTTIEAQFGTNHLGPFLFTNLIKPRLAASQSPRIVNVASSGHQWAALQQDPGFNNGKRYTANKAYGQSKTANMLFAVALSEKWKDIEATSFSLHPGIVNTNLGRHLTPFMLIKAVGALIGIISTKIIKWDVGKSPMGLKSMGQGAATHIVAAFDPSIAGESGAYLSDCTLRNSDAAPYALDKREAERLWRMSEETLGQRFD
ncbi:short-chain dehydrogenase [Pseudohyphozyma bogoriensis]|nr:short-chain dehydrogenase [Pseudohyphozyma bogoriensis]